MEDDNPPLPPPQHPLPSPPPPTYTLSAVDISYKKSTSFLDDIVHASPLSSFTRRRKLPSPPSAILHDISLTAYPSQILAVVGPSGAGKSTLLDILAARTAPTSGSILLNSSPINPSSFRKLSAYVPQHDAFLPLLTIYETFSFAASLLIHDRASGAAVIDGLLKELGLSHLANSLLGKSLSGGERRRVSIGLSLLRDPGVLLLDEPTSGLDSKSAFNVIQILKSISVSRNRTVILSIHQPGFKILSFIDRILLLSKGAVVHHGTLSDLQGFLLDNGFTVPPQLNALEYSMEILAQLRPVTERIVTVPSSPSLDATTPDCHATHEVQIHPPKPTRHHRSSRVHEILTVYNRSWRVIYRTRQLLLTNTLEALIVGIILGTIYINVGIGKEGIEKRFGLFAFTLTFLLSSTTETLPVFIDERPILLREASSGVYRLSSYLIANTLVFIPYLLAIAILYSASVYFLVGLCPTWQAFSYFALVIWAIVLMANSFVLFLSSVAPNYISGTSLVTMFLGAFFLFSGYFISKGSIPRYWLPMHFLSMYKYALDAMIVNEYSCLGTRCMIWYEEGKACMVTGREVMEKKGLMEGDKWENVYVMVGFFLFYRLLWLVVLVRRVSRSRK
ncbi:hypothetical protein MLD38_009020 [Melastoma candidum]|uniref:Uncharacterized protein n=1 Tax=Melastoma candidum TaxID=119954 RepID=A0ACB9RVM8_9MYRT|nr:hypothetical protein MLD38_009020 [Melastoma candidum]